MAIDSSSIIQNGCDVLYILSFGFAARTVMHTMLVPELRKCGKTVVAICSGADEPSFKNLAEKKGIKLWPAPATNKWFQSEYLAMRRYFFEDVRQNPALWSRHLREIENGNSIRCQQRRVLFAVNQVLKGIPPAQTLMEKCETGLIRNPKARLMLRSICPKIVVATYPVNALEAEFLGEAKRIGIPTVVQLLSWDNITCKGRFPVIADYYLSWGPVMTEELYSYYRVDKDRIFETGVAHFDAHVSLVDSAVNQRMLTGMGLSPDQPYLLFGMSSPYFAPHEIDIVETLAHALRQNAFGADLNMVVRPHPQNVSGYMADQSWLPRIRALQGERVGVNWPKLQESEMAWAFQEDDLGELVNLMAGCTINLNSGSTFGIDGLAHGKPVIMTFFDADRQIPWHRSARRAADFIHLRKMIDMKGVFPVWSYEELYRTIAQLMEYPQLSQKARKMALSAYCTAIDGRASERIANTLNTILNKSNRMKTWIF